MVINRQDLKNVNTLFFHKDRVLGMIPNEVFLSDLSDKKYPRPDEIEYGFMIDDIICMRIVSWLWIAFFVVY